MTRAAPFRELFLSLAGSFVRPCGSRRVGKVLRPSGREFRGYEVAGGNEIRLQAGRRVNHAFNAPFPSRVKFDAGNIGKDIEAFRLTSKTKETAAVGEVLGAAILERCAELGKRGPGGFRVRGAAFMKTSIYFVKRGCA